MPKKTAQLQVTWQYNALAIPWKSCPPLHLTCIQLEGRPRTRLCMWGTYCLNDCVEQKDMCLIDIVRSPWPKTYSIFLVQYRSRFFNHISCVIVYTPFQVQSLTPWGGSMKTSSFKSPFKTPFPRQIAGLHIACCNKQTKHTNRIWAGDRWLCVKVFRKFTDIQGQPNARCNERYHLFHRTCTQVPTCDLWPWHLEDGR